MARNRIKNPGPIIEPEKPVIKSVERDGPQTHQEPSILEKMLEMFGVKMEDVLAFKDTPADYRIITNNGKKFILPKGRI